ncbi:NgoFVII family restriction endonuclease, partial [Neisseria gonorrhoeae]
MTQLFLHSDTPNEKELISIYEKAVSEAVELYIFSAYLTHWDVKNKLNSKLQEFKFIFGQDFGLSKKEAIRKVLKWLPSHLKFTLMVAQGIQGFHPKAVFWKNDKNEYYALIGSSNLTHAAFNSNYEANILTKISEQDFIKVKSWADEIAMKSIPVSEDWLEEYQEAEINYKKSTVRQSVMDKLFMEMPNYNQELIAARRKQMRNHQTVCNQLKNLIKQCAAGKIDNNDFYGEFNKLWSWKSENKGEGVGNRFQDKTWKRTGKSSDFRKLCIAIQSVFDAPLTERDNVVAKQIDWLKECGVSTRGSVFSEMLCQEYPDRYPVLNAPIKKFLEENKFK